MRMGPRNFPNQSEGTPKRSLLGSWLIRAVLGAWGLGLITICAYLLGGHLLTLPTPELANSQLQQALAQRKASSHSTNYQALHVLYGTCGCSRRVLHKLLKRGSSSLVEERVVLINPREEDIIGLKDTGFAWEVATAQELEKDFAIQSAPLLVLAAPDGELRYVGGYTDRKRGPDIKDLDLIAAVRSGELPLALPVYGCAVNAELAQKVDPLGLR